MHTSDPNGSRTQRIKDPEGRGVTSRGRSERPQMILTSPLEVFSGSEQARIHHVPQAGCSHGDRGNVVLRLFPRRSFLLVPLHPGGCAGGERPGFLDDGFPWFSFLRGGKVSMEGPFDPDDPPIRVPSGEGKRRQVDRPEEPVPYSKTSGDVSPMDGWIPGPIRSP
jgi:hypothetical protein